MMTILMHPRRRAQGRKCEDVDQLPHEPSLRYLRRQSREVQRETGLPLHAAQRSVAQRYGFGDWPSLKRTVEAGELVTEWSGRLLGKRALESLRDAGESPQASDIVAALKHPNPRVRYDCLGLLDHLADEESVDAIVVATADPVGRVRRMAVHALGCQRCKASALCARLSGVFVPIARHDPVWRVRREAVLSLVQQPPDEESRAALAYLVEHDPHPLVRHQAAWALRLQRGLGRSYTGGPRR